MTIYCQALLKFARQIGQLVLRSSQPLDSREPPPRARPGAVLVLLAAVLLAQRGVPKAEEDAAAPQPVPAGDVWLGSKAVVICPWKKGAGPIWELPGHVLMVRARM